eukprot:332037-Prymnesium_polylepis.1
MAAHSRTPHAAAASCMRSAHPLVVATHQVVQDKRCPTKMAPSFSVMRSSITADEVVDLCT